METVFDVATKVAWSGWAALVAGLYLPAQRPVLFLYGGRILPALLAMAYVTMLGFFLAEPPPVTAEPVSIAGVRQMLAADAGLAAAWFHFLAFDLVFALWAARDGLERSIPRWTLIAVFAVTYMAGPTGLLLYLTLAAFVRKRAR